MSFLLDTNVASDLRRPQRTNDSFRVHDLTLVTRNTADFAGCEVEIVNAWDA